MALKITEYAKALSHLNRERGLDRVLFAVSKKLPHIPISQNVRLDTYIREHAYLNDSCHIVDLRMIVNRYCLWGENFPDIHPYFSVKTNHDPVVVVALAALDAGFECSTSGEIEHVLSLGVSPQRIIFANPRKSLSTISSIIHHKVPTVVVDSIDEIKKMKGSSCPKTLLRIFTEDHNSGTPLSSKFGIKKDEAKKIIDFACLNGFRLDGIAFHVGSNNLDIKAYIKAIEDSRQLFDYSLHKFGRKMHILDIGGGWPGDRDSAYIDIASRINQALSHYFNFPVKMIAEPGRFLCMNSTTLVSKILGKRVQIDKKGNKTMEYFISNGVYGFFLSSLYFQNTQKSLAEGWKFRALNHKKPLFLTRLWGPTLDSGDKVIDQIKLPELNEEDLILTSNTGSYGRVYQSDFASYPRSEAHYIVSKR